MNKQQLKIVEEDIRVVYKDVLSEEQIQATIKWWNKLLTKALKATKKQAEKDMIEKIRKSVECDFLDWATYNSYDLGEFGKFVRLEYLVNYCSLDFPYNKPLSDNDLLNATQRRTRAKDKLSSLQNSKKE